MYQFYGENLEAGYWIVNNNHDTLTLEDGIVREIYMHLGGSGPEQTNSASASTGSTGDMIFSVNGNYNSIAYNYFKSKNDGYNHAYLFKFTDDNLGISSLSLNITRSFSLTSLKALII